MSIHGFCFDIGSSGHCCGNCYMCNEEFGGNLSDEDIAKNQGEDEQERMLKEYDYEGDK